MSNVRNAWKRIWSGSLLCLMGSTVTHAETALTAEIRKLRRNGEIVRTSANGFTFTPTASRALAGVAGVSEDDVWSSLESRMKLEPEVEEAFKSAVL